MNRIATNNLDCDLTTHTPIFLRLNMNVNSYSSAVLNTLFDNSYCTIICTTCINSQQIIDPHDEINSKSNTYQFSRLSNKGAKNIKT